MVLSMPDLAEAATFSAVSFTDAMAFFPACIVAIRSAAPTRGGREGAAYIKAGKGLRGVHGKQRTPGDAGGS